MTSRVGCGAERRERAFSGGETLRGVPGLGARASNPEGCLVRQREGMAKGPSCRDNYFGEISF